MTVKITREVHGEETTIEADTAYDATMVLFAIDSNLAKANTESDIEFNYGTLYD